MTRVCCVIEDHIMRSRIVSTQVWLGVCLGVLDEPAIDAQQGHQHLRVQCEGVLHALLREVLLDATKQRCLGCRSARVVSQPQPHILQDDIESSRGSSKLLNEKNFLLVFV